MKESMLKAYANLIARAGANVQPGQAVFLSAAVDQHAFAAMVAEACYQAGASRVVMQWSDQKMTLLHYQYQTLETLSTVHPQDEARLKEMSEIFPCRVFISSEDPMGLAGIDRMKMQKASQATWPIIKPYREAIENRHQWTIAAAASPEWAARVFPDLPVDEAVEKLWEAILSCSRVIDGGDPLAAWDAHNSNFVSRCAWLNAQNFDTITYKSANGTDFTAKLIPEGQWCGGGEKTIGGVFFNPNIPTEEIFTTPMKGQAEGTLVSTRPLSYQGQLIDGFSITFRGGRAVEWHARVGEELLTQMITMDDGAAMLGELALVPNSSPICRSGILFYETLFDENASCHVALGRGFNDCIRDFQNRTDEECQALGVNDSMIHVDFMVGADDLCITGWKDGVPTPILVNGEWAV